MNTTKKTPKKAITPITTHFIRQYWPFAIGWLRERIILPAQYYLWPKITWQKKTLQITLPNTKIPVPKMEIEKKRIMKQKELTTVAKATFDQPILFLIKENHDVEILENVESGLFITKDKNGKDKGAINLTDAKILSLKYGASNIKCWIANEKDFSTYPTAPLMDSIAMLNLLKRILTENKLLEETGDFWEFIKGLWPLFLIIALALIAWQMGWLNQWLPPAQTVAQTAINNTTAINTTINNTLIAGERVIV